MRFCPACGAALPHTPPVTCAECGTSHWRNAKPCAGALVVHEDRLLLVRRNHEPWYGYWDIPGGFCDVDEHPSETAVREVREETGWHVEVTDLLGLWLDDYGDPDRPEGGDTVTLNVYYHAAIVGGEARPDPIEVAELGWFAPDHLPERIAFPKHATQVLSAWREAVAASATRDPGRRGGGPASRPA